MKNTRLQNWIFGLSLLALGIAGFVMNGTDSQWSEGMIRRQGLGFHHKLDRPLLAVELADTKEHLFQVFGTPPDTEPVKDPTVKGDIIALRKNLIWDFLFLTGYSFAFVAITLRLRSLKAIEDRLFKPFIALIVVVAVCDILENTICLLLEIPNTANGYNLGYSPFEHWFSLAKWAGSFVLAVALGCQILRTLRPASLLQQPLGTAWCFAAVLFVVGGLTGCLGLFDEVLISPAFQITGLATLPVLFAWRWRSVEPTLEP